MIEFEYDEAKSQSNKQKHGIDFVEAQALWSDPNLVEIQARTEDEPRALIIGLIDAKHCVGNHHRPRWKSKNYLG